jgi:hypothetical protein
MTRSRVRLWRCRSLVESSSGRRERRRFTRELGEEIGATPTRIDYLGLLEDIFVWAGQKRHELYLVYDIELAERAVYQAEEVPVVEPDGTSYSARWRRLNEFESSARLVPTGLVDVIKQSSS